MSGQADPQASSTLGGAAFGSAGATHEAAASTPPPPRTAINYVRRLQKRAHYDDATVHSIIDASLICHAAISIPASVDGLSSKEDWPIAMPMVHGRKGRTIYLHGYISGRLMKRLATPNPNSGSKDNQESLQHEEGKRGDVQSQEPSSTAEPSQTEASEVQLGPRTALTFTLVDGLVFALTPFHNSMNYRSACVFGHARLVTDLDEKDEALRVMTNHAFQISGGGDRYGESRPPNDAELRSTKVIAVDNEAGSAKIRSQDVGDDAADMQDAELTKKVWAGVVNLETKWTTAEAMPYSSTQPLPEYIERMMTVNR